MSKELAFTEGHYRFVLDREGATVDDGGHGTIELARSFAPEALGFSITDDLVVALGERLSLLFGARVDDPEGLFDVKVMKGERVVAALVLLPCEELDCIEVAGECARDVTKNELLASLEASLSRAE